MDMRYHWLHCRTTQQQFRIYWQAGSTNLGDYVTKHHPAIHHQTMRPIDLTPLQHPGAPQVATRPTLISHCKGVLHMPTQCKVHSGKSQVELIYICKCIWSVDGLEMRQCVTGVVDFVPRVGCHGSARCIK
eukprot:CCRYP_004119-RA/>CCRYP_004119-RA protein AED:0.38 eAED:0.38 QI:0/-1/0/1/-1/0/1/0/130